MVRFHTIFDKLSQTLDDLPYDELGISDEVREQVFFVFIMNHNNASICEFCIQIHGF